MGINLIGLLLLLADCIDASIVPSRFVNNAIKKRFPIEVCSDHLRKIQISQRKGKPMLIGLHHDRGRKFEKKGLISYRNIRPGPQGSFGADIVIEGVDYGFKTFFPPDWSYEKIKTGIIALCKAYHDKKDSNLVNKVTFQGLIEEILTQIVYNSRRGYVISAYPLIPKQGVMAVNKKRIEV